MAKEIQLNIPVKKLVDQYPDLIPVLKELGFNRITDPLALNTLGRTVTLKQGAGIMNIPLAQIEAGLQAHGFQVKKDNASGLKELLNRLNQGEDMEQVRADFIKDFESVSVSDIIDAEQELINEGTPETEIQRLCDLHSALFHGRTEAEILAEEKADQQEWDLIQILIAENRQLEKRIAVLNHLLKEPQPQVEEIRKQLEDLKNLKKHYAKKEELIMPYLYDAGITSPSTVMWALDDEILKDNSRFAKLINPDNLNEYIPQIKAMLQRMAEMIYKEENILFPMAQQTLDEEAWLETYGDIQEYGLAWLDSVKPWAKGEKWLQEHPYVPADLEIDFPTGRLSVQQLKTLFDTLPIDITYIDKDDKLIFFTNEGHVFARPRSAIGRNVLGCHPPRIIPVVEKMLADFKAGKRNRVERWIPNPDKPVKVVYQAVYDQNGEYAGTIEMVQRDRKSVV